MAGDIIDMGRRLTLDLASKMPGSARFTAVGLIRAMLVLSMACLAASPLIAGDSYSLMRHTVSEAGGQGFSGGWLVRTGLVLVLMQEHIMLRIMLNWLCRCRPSGDRAKHGQSHRKQEYFIHGILQTCDAFHLDGQVQLIIGSWWYGRNAVWDMI